MMREFLGQAVNGFITGLAIGAVLVLHFKHVF